LCKNVGVVAKSETRLLNQDGGRAFGKSPEVMKIENSSWHNSQLDSEN